jgi:phosphoglycolate phosphatase
LAKPGDFLVLFDVDGTLLDGERLISDTMAEAFDAAGVAPPPRQIIASFIGLSAPEMIAGLTTDMTADRRDVILAGYLRRFASALDFNHDPPVFDGAEGAILRLREAGVTLGLATGKSERSVRHFLDGLAWTDHFATVQCADDNASKPDPDMLHRALKATGKAASRTFLIGDSTFDMRMARAAGVGAIGVSWGVHPTASLLSAGAEMIVDDFKMLVDGLLEKMQ